jgi:hypothetical protein
MTRYHVLGALSALVVAGVGAACGNGGTGGSTSSGNPTSSGTGGGGVGGAGVGGMTTGPGSGGATTTGTGGAPSTGMLCPDSLFSPKNANSVQVTDATLMADTTWDASHVYLVTQSFEVDDLKTLTIEAGTVVCLASGATFSVGPVNGGAVIIKGTAAAHVVFTAADDGTGHPDFWGGIDLNNFDGSKVSYLDVDFAARGAGTTRWAFQMSGAPGAPFLLDHLTIQGSRAGGYRIGPNGVAPGSVIDLQGFYPPGANPPSTYEAAVQVDIDTSGTLNDPGVTLTFDTAHIPAESRYIHVNGVQVSESVTWSDLGLPYRLPDGLPIFGDYTQNKVVDLTLDAGVTVQLEGSLVIGNTQFQGQPDLGNLIVKGTAAKPVTFTSAQLAPASGDWGAIYFVESSFDPAVTAIDHARIMYGGADIPGAMVASCQDGGDSHAGLVSIEGSGLNGNPFTGPSITNTTFAHSLHDGVRSHFAPKNLTQDRIDRSYGDPTYGNTFTDIAGHPFLDPTDPTADTCM